MTPTPPPERSAGFTLMEVLIVLSVLGILLAIGIVNLSGARDSARQQAARTHGYEVTQALEGFIATYAPLPAATVMQAFPAASEGPPGLTLSNARACASGFTLSKSGSTISAAAGGGDSGLFGWKAAGGEVRCAMAAASANGDSSRYRVRVYTWVGGASRIYLGGDAP